MEAALLFEYEFWLFVVAFYCLSWFSNNKLSPFKDDYQFYFILCEAPATVRYWSQLTNALLALILTPCFFKFLRDGSFEPLAFLSFILELPHEFLVSFFVISGIALLLVKSIKQAKRDESFGLFSSFVLLSIGQQLSLESIGVLAGSYLLACLFNEALNKMSQYLQKSDWYKQAGLPADLIVLIIVPSSVLIAQFGPILLTAEMFIL